MLQQMNIPQPCGGTATVTVGPSSLAPCVGSGPLGLERTRFFPRQLVTPDDLTQDQVYFRDKLRRHNRMLHGWGVVCGARCRWKAGDCNVILEPGYILGPYGDEIVIGSQQTVDVCKQNMDGNTFSACGDLVDPWCKDVRASRKSGQTYYLAIRYEECQCRPVSVPSGACGCSDGGCEYTRIRDSYVIQVLEELPSNYRDVTLPVLSGVFRCDRRTGGRSCPPCPTDPWVILADFTLSVDGTLASLDCYAHRRYVASFAEYFFTCRGGLQYGTHEMTGAMAQGSGLMDMRMAESSIAPSRAVAVKLASGTWTTMPIYFSVTAGETLGTLLEAEGERQYYDPSSGDTYTLRELYSVAGTKPDTVLGRVEDAIRPLEGLTLDVPGLRVVQGSITGLISDSGMGKLQAAALGNPSAAPTLKADALQGIEAGSKLGKAVAGKTIAEVAAMPVAEFVKKATAGVPVDRVAALKTQAREVWSNASRVVNLANAWKKG